MSSRNLDNFFTSRKNRLYKKDIDKHEVDSPQTAVQKPDSGLQKTPTSSQKTPTSSQKTPTTSQKTPTTSQKTPTTSQKTPTTSQKTPTTSQKTPTSSQKTPTTYQKTPTTYQKTPTTSQKRSRSSRQSGVHPESVPKRQRLTHFFNTEPKDAETVDGVSARRRTVDGVSARRPSELTAGTGVQPEKCVGDISKQLNGDVGSTAEESSVNPWSRDVNITPQLKVIKSSGEKTKQDAEQVSMVTSSQSPIKGAALESPRQVAMSPSSKKPVGFSSPGKTQLVLPAQFFELERMFRALEFLLKQAKKRGQRPTFTSLKPSVERSMVRRAPFTTKRLGQILTVYPEGFKVYRALDSIKRSQLYVEGVDTDSQAGFSSLIVFRERLEGIVREHHAKFLLSLNPTIEVPQQLYRWHEDFQLESVPEIEALPLPKPPAHVDRQREILDHLEHQHHLRLGTVPEKMGTDSEEKESPQTPSRQSTADPAKLNAVSEKMDLPQTPQKSRAAPAKSEMSPSLLKLQQRLAAKKLAAMTASPVQSELQLRLSKLPGIYRTLCGCFWGLKASSLPLTQVLQKISDNFKLGISRGDVEAHIDLLVRCVPEHVEKFSISTGTFVRLAQTTDRNKVISTITDRSKDIKN